MSLATVREGLAAACEAAGLNCVGYVTDDISTPAAVIAIQPFEYQLVMAANRAPITYKLSVYVERTDEVGAQEQLDEWIDPTSASSLKAILETASVATAAGVDYVWVKAVDTPVQQVQFGSITYLSVEFTVEVVV